MRDINPPFLMTRRNFVKVFGGSAVGGSLLSRLSGEVQAAEGGEEENEAHEGKVPLALTLNGRPVQVLVAPNATLAEVIRGELELPGTKISCNRGQCGSCTVLLNGKAVYACHMLALDAQGGKLLTIEGLMRGEKLSPLQQAFVDEDGLQCGFCTPGQIMSAYALLLKTPKPSREEVIEHLSGNLCRCGAYPKIIRSVLAAAD